MATWFHQSGGLGVIICICQQDLYKLVTEIQIYIHTRLSCGRPLSCMESIVNTFVILTIVFCAEFLIYHNCSKDLRNFQVMQRHSETEVPVTLQTLLQLCFFYLFGCWVWYDSASCSWLLPSSALMKPVVLKPKEYYILTP